MLPRVTQTIHILANELGFIKVYTSPYTPLGNSIIEWAHAFLKVSLRKLISNYQIDRDEIVYIITNAYNVFPHCSTGEALFYLMFKCDPFMPTLFILLLPKL